MLTAFRAPASELDVALPFQSLFHPMGHPLEIRANSPEPLCEAARLWRRYPRISLAAPVRISIVVNSTPAGFLPRPSTPEIRGSLFFISHGPYDFAVADLTAGLAVACLSPGSIGRAADFCYHFLEPLAYVLLGARHFFYIHASCVSRRGRAIVLCGDSGAGKTCLAYACAKRGWDFVSGDAVHVIRDDPNRILGRPYEIRFRESARSLFPELNRFQPAVRPNGKLDLEIDTADLPIQSALEARAARIVFIERSSDTRLEPCSPGDAIAALTGTICYGDDPTQSEQRGVLTRLAELPVCRLRYASLDQAAQALEQLLA